jgi:hypothetical protein
MRGAARGGVYFDVELPWFRDAYYDLWFQLLALRPQEVGDLVEFQLGDHHLLLHAPQELQRAVYPGNELSLDDVILAF